MEAGDLSGIESERQIAFFGFSGVSFVDSTYNIFVDAWEEVCKKEFNESLKQLSEKDRLAFLAFPFSDENVKKMFTLMKRYCVTEIFKIPASVTLPECIEMQKAAASDVMDQAAAEKLLKEKREQLLQRRIELIKKKDEVEAMNEKIEVLQAIIKAQDKMIKEKEGSSQTPKSPVQ